MQVGYMHFCTSRAVSRLIYFLRRQQHRYAVPCERKMILESLTISAVFISMLLKGVSKFLSREFVLIG